MKYKFTRVVARVEITFGVIFILAGIAPAAAAFAVAAHCARCLLSGVCAHDGAINGKGAYA
jgi:hypothetical protein